MKMTFGKVIQLILMFYNLAIRHADDVTGGSAANGALLMLKDETFVIRTGYAAEQELTADCTNGTLTMTLE